MGENQEQREVTADVAAFDKKAFDRKMLITGFFITALAAFASVAAVTMNADNVALSGTQDLGAEFLLIRTQ